MVGLTGGEVQTFADVFYSVGPARAVLATAGLSRARHPSWDTSLTFWSEVAQLVEAGAWVDGRRRLLDAAGDLFPGNPVFAAGRGGASDVRKWNVPPRPVRFVGRENLLAEVHDALSGPGRVALVALDGLGGVGKTAVALEYAYRHAGAMELVWWVPSERAELVGAHFADMAVALGVPAGSDEDGVWSALRSVPSWLVVFDNVEDVQTVARFRPSGGGRVLITSRNRAVRALGRGVLVAPLERSVSVELLAARIPAVDGAAVGQVAQLLGDLPLALEQAASFCEQTGTPAEVFAGLLADRLEETLGLGEVVDRAGVTVSSVWDLSVERLASSDPAAVELLELLSFCDAEPLPLDLFEHRVELGGGPLADAAGDPVRWARTVGALVAYSLVGRVGGTVRVHRLVQAATRRRLRVRRKDEALEVLMRLLQTDLPADVRRNPGAWQRWRELLPHVRAVVDRVPDPQALAGSGDPDVPPAAQDLVLLCERAAMYLQEHGQVTESLPMFQRALEIVEAFYGPDHPAVATRLSYLASALLDLGRAAEALWAYRRALAVIEAVDGADHHGIAVCLNGAALALQDLGRADEALPMLRRGLEATELVHGPDHPEVAVNLNNLALALQRLGRPGEALPMFQRALTLTEAHYGPDHPEVAYRVSNLASAMHDLGRPSEAVPMFARSEAVAAAVFGPDHSHVATALNNQALALQSLGLVTETLPMLRQALTITEAVYGPDHPEVATRLNNLALALRDTGFAAGALPMIQRALMIDETVYGPSHPTVAADLNSLRAVLFDLGCTFATLPMSVQKALRLNREAAATSGHHTASMLSEITSS